MDIGNILLLSTLAIQVVSLLFLAKSAGGSRLSLITAERIHYLSTVFIMFASIYLMTLILNHRFDYSYVYHNSSADMSAFYLTAAFWAGHQGSLLLWLFMINISGVLLIWKKDQHENIVLSIITVTQIFMLMILLVDSPFKMIWEQYPDLGRGSVPPEGAGINPILMDPWMIAHPPVLFLGYATAVIPFGYAIAAMLKNDAKALLGNSRMWLLFSILTLGLGIFMGGYWAYKVLGWGGYWGWDPVENSSLIPWLVGLALAHGLIIQKRKGALVRTNLLLAVSYFILVFYSTFLTRSGILSNFSVHSFADYGLTGYLLSFMAFYLIISVALFIKKGKSIAASAAGFAPLSWEMLLIYGVLTITAYAAVILGGTSMPIISGWFLESPTAATVNFYNGITVPFGIVILVLMLASLFIMVKAEMRSMANIAVAVISAAAGIMFNIMYTGFPPAYIFSVLALLIVFYHAKEIIFARSPKNLLPSRIAHIGVAVMVLGIIASSYHSSGERKKIIKDRADQVGPAVLTFKGITNEERSRLTFTLSHSAGLSEISVPYYYNERMNSLYREPFIEYGLFGDIYIIPESYDSGIDSVSIKRLTVGDDLEFSGLKIAFKGFNTSGMTSETPTVKAELTFNGRPAAPEIKMVMGRKEMIRAAVPGTDRFVTLTGLDIKHRMIEIYLTPGKSVTVPEDSVIVDVSVKRLIWFVWFGTVLISIGVFLGIFKD